MTNHTRQATFTDDTRQAKALRSPVTRHSGGFRKTLSFGLTSLVYYATELFCRRNFNLKNDPLGKTFAQMIASARSAKHNIVEGSSRARTSRDTELRLYDVAKGSLEELAGDYEDFLFSRGELPWSENDPKRIRAMDLKFDVFEARDDIRHSFFVHLAEMRQRFAPAIENNDPVIAANAILVTIDRACWLLRRQMEALGDDSRRQGSSSERPTKARPDQRDDDCAAYDDAPKCPKCGGPMRRLVAKKGANAGKPFWSCTAYPNCTGSRRWNCK